MNVIKKLNKLVKDIYTVEIISNSEVIKDDYLEGEGEVRNYWDNDKTLFHTEAVNLKTELKQYLINYIEDVLFVDCSEEFLFKTLKEFEDEQHFFISKMIDVNNQEPSIEQILKWKKGKEEIFVENIEITVLINGTELPVNLLLEIIEN